MAGSSESIEGARGRSDRPDRREIELRAYFIYVEEGGGDADEHWLRAERELGSDGEGEQAEGSPGAAEGPGGASGAAGSSGGDADAPPTSPRR